MRATAPRIRAIERVIDGYAAELAAPTWQLRDDLGLYRRRFAVLDCEELNRPGAAVLWT